jgi:hypothetical protein
MYKKTKIVTPFTVAVAVIILFANFSHGQETSAVTKESGGVGYSMFGRGTIGIGGLNTKLESKGYSRMSESFFSVGGGGHGIVNNRMIIGGEGHTLLGDAATSGNYKNSITISYIFFDLGYIVYSLKELRLYPLLGVGVGGMNLKITEEVKSLSIDDALDNPQRGIELSTGGFLLNFALGIDYLLIFGQDETTKAGMILGIRAGYTFAPSKGSWSMDEIEVSGAPEIGITGPYIRFTLGGGAIGNRK